jgi:ankyrin repeat protein
VAVSAAIFFWIAPAAVVFWLSADVGAILGVSAAYAGPLFDAAVHGDSAAVENLLDGSVDVDERGHNEETPLIAAALAGEVAIAEILIAHGANVMARNKGGLTPLHAAAYSGSAAVARILLDHGAALDDKTNISGTTPLIVAAEENRVSVAELLLARGADLKITDRDGFDALSQAWAKKRPEMVRLLKQHGAVCQPVEILGSEEYHRRCVEDGT